MTPAAKIGCAGGNGMSAQFDYDLVVIGSGPAGEERGAGGVLWQARGGDRACVAFRRSGHQHRHAAVEDCAKRRCFSGLRQAGYGIDYSLKEGLTVVISCTAKMSSSSESDLIEANLMRHHIDVLG
jgi:alkyl hydroperoxide reductase subunit AhpF